MKTLGTNQAAPTTNCTNNPTKILPCCLDLGRVKTYPAKLLGPKILSGGLLQEWGEMMGSGGRKPGL